MVAASFVVSCNSSHWKDTSAWRAIWQYPSKLPSSSAGKESTYNAGGPRFDSWVRKIPWGRDRLPTPVFLGLPGGSAGKESACNTGDLVQFLGWEDPLEKGTATHASILVWRIPQTV